MFRRLQNIGTSPGMRQGARVFVVETFTGNGTWTRPIGVDYVRVQAIAGGGGAISGANGYSGAGGGAGGFLDTWVDVSNTRTVAVTIGGGGANAAGQVTPTNNSASRGSSTTFGTLATAFGGGAGVAYPASSGVAGSVGSYAGGVGGSGGGSTDAFANNYIGVTIGQGNNGAGLSGTNGGGGGGAGSAGTAGGNGGSGKVAMNGTTYAAGGNYTGGAAGAANTGNGGQGAAAHPAGAGGSGILLVGYYI